MKWALSTNTLIKAIRKYKNQGKLVFFQAVQLKWNSKAVGYVKTAS